VPYQRTTLTELTPKNETTDDCRYSGNLADGWVELIQADLTEDPNHLDPVHGRKMRHYTVNFVCSPLFGGQIFWRWRGSGLTDFG